MMENSEDLALPDTTLSAIEAASKEQKTAEAKAVEAQAVALRALNALLDEGLSSEKDLLKAGRVAVNATTQIRELRLRYTLEVRGLLSAEQLKSYMLHRKSAQSPSPSRR